MQANFINGWGISSEIMLRWMSLDLIDDKSTLIQVTVQCWQATSHHNVEPMLTLFFVTIWRHKATMRMLVGYCRNWEKWNPQFIRRIGWCRQASSPSSFSFLLNLSIPGQNGHHFADNSIRCIFVNEKFCILIKISLQFVNKCPIDNNPALV